MRWGVGAPADRMLPATRRLSATGRAVKVCVDGVLSDDTTIPRTYRLVSDILVRIKWCTPRVYSGRADEEDQDMSTDCVETARPGEWVNAVDALPDDRDLYPMRIPTDRYTSVEFQGREREAIWMRVWQIVGRVDELPKVRRLEGVPRSSTSPSSSCASKDEQVARVRQCLPASRQHVVQGHRQCQARVLVPIPPVVLRPRRKNAGRPAGAENVTHPRRQRRERACCRCPSTPSAASSS